VAAAEAGTKPVAIFDIDGTIFRSSLLIELTEQLIKAQVFPASIEGQYTDDYHAWLDRRGSYETYLKKLIEAFAEHVKGVKPVEVGAAAEQVLKQTRHQTYRYTRDLISQLKKTHFLIAISGSPVEMVARFAQYYGFNAFRATTYDIKNGVYTGECQVSHNRKDLAVKGVLEQYSLGLDNSLGVGDTESDAAFLEVVTRPIAFNPNSALFELAATRGWQIVVERKDVIYYYNQNA
jgi:HAD superfamily hydrolase (TIGR01490 family)